MMFFAAMTNSGAGKNVVFVTQINGCVTKETHCAAEGFVFVGKRFAWTARRGAFSAPRLGSDVDTTPDVIENSAGQTTRDLSMQPLSVLLTTRSLAVVQGIVDVIGTFPSASESFVFEANWFLFVTETIVKIEPADNTLIEMDLGSVEDMKSNVSVTESNLSISESRPIDALQSGSARSRDTFNLETCSAAKGTSDCLPKCIIRVVLFSARLIGTELSRSNGAGSLSVTQGLATDHFLGMTVLPATGSDRPPTLTKPLL
jgi:hypothetical protein